MAAPFSPLSGAASMIAGPGEDDSAMAQVQAEAARFEWPRWFDRALKAFLALVVASTLGFLAESFAIHAGLLPAAAWSKASFSVEPPVPAGWSKVTQVDPEGQFGKAGIMVGDLVKPDNPFYHMQNRFAGDQAGFTIERGGQRIHLNITEMPVETDPAATRSQWIVLLEDLKSLALTAFALVLLARRWREKAATCLAFLLLGYSIPGGVLPHWAGSGIIAWAIIWLQMAGIALVVFALPFCHYLIKPRMDRRDQAVFLIWAAISIPFTLLIGLSMALRWQLPTIGQPIVLFPLVFGGLVATAIVILRRNFRAADAAGRNRIKMVAAALVLSVLGYALSTIVQIVLGSRSALFFPMIGLATLIVASGPLLLVYTVLRHKLFDFGFVVKRALVYGFVSALILVGIGLAEWAAKKLVPESWHDASKVYSAAIALVLFLLFHRIHHWVEHQVEHLFFHKWQANEARLREFIDAAAHYERQDSLMRDTVAEFRRFTGTGEVALYWRQDGEDYARLHGELAAPFEQIDADDPAVARARVSRGAVVVEDTRSALPASLVLPVIDHGQIVGLLALGAKPNSVGFRPDEVEVMAWAAQQAGLDLQSMRARNLETKVATLEAQVERLSAILSARTADA